jgi:2-hydroxychromene-2-carboxylate isomerase
LIEGRALTMAEVDFYFDFSCPWTYLAFTRLKETATRTGATINWHPFLLADLFERIKSDVPADRGDPDPRRSRYRSKDLQDWARFCSVTIRIPKPWPVSSESAACGAVVAVREGRAQEFGAGIFRACFEAGSDISSPAVVADVAVAVGFERSEFEQAVQGPEVRQQVRANAAALIKRGGFGSPTMFVGDDMFFGNDRMPLVEFSIGQTSGRTFVMPGQHG